MHEKITYILGAGFSAPLGLPLMNNFLVKSKDLYLSDQKKYSHFKKVLDTIDQLSVIKNYFDADLFNIEEILSIIEMGTFLDGKRFKKEFTRYISDVIESCTPKIEPFNGELPPGYWPNQIFGDESIQTDYCYFVANLLGIEFGRREELDHGERKIRYFCRRISNQKFKYAVITLNYDLVLENVCTFIKGTYEVENQIDFNRSEDPEDWASPPLAKLHGSVDIDLIVPPTWAKASNLKISPMWKSAYQILMQSNHIRFIGYSLPVADAYVKYLLKSAISKAKHLKSIDVICLDKDGSVKKEFDRFIHFNYYRFANAKVEDYMKLVHAEQKKCISEHHIRGQSKITMDVLENIHGAFMNGHALK